MPPRGNPSPPGQLRPLFPTSPARAISIEYHPPSGEPPSVGQDGCPAPGRAPDAKPVPVLSRRAEPPAARANGHVLARHPTVLVDLAVDDGRDAHAVADAEGDRAVAQVAPLELVEQRGEQNGAGGAQRMAERDGAAVHVDAVERDTQLLRHHDRHRGEGLVDLPQVDVLHRQPGARERLLRGGNRAGQHQHRVRAGDRGGDDARARLEAQALAPSRRWRPAPPRRRRRCPTSCRRGSRRRP